MRATTALLATALVTLPLMWAAAARPPSRPSTPGSQQTGSLPGSTQPQTPDARQISPTPSSSQPALPNAFLGGAAPSQPAASTFTVANSTLTITEFGQDGAIRVSSVPPGGRAILPLEMQR